MQVGRVRDVRLPRVRPPSSDGTRTPWAVECPVPASRRPSALSRTSSNLALARPPPSPPSETRERLRRLQATQRKRRAELVRAEDEAFRALLRQSAAASECVAAFVAFRRAAAESSARREALFGPWTAAAAARRLAELAEAEGTKRRALVAQEWRVRRARQRVEWMDGAQMRFGRAIDALTRAEVSRRRFIMNAEMREAREIPAVRPYVASLAGIASLGRCPFVERTDCPFFARGEGEASAHFGGTERHRA